MYSYIHSYVSLCICICIMSMHRSLKHTYVCLGVCPTLVSKWGEGRYQAVPGVADSGGFCSVVYNLRAVEERWSSLLECVRFSPTHRILSTPPHKCIPTQKPGCFKCYSKC